jgi:hypothetical protein
MKDLLEGNFKIAERLLFFNKRLVIVKTFNERLLIFFKLTMSNHCREGLVKTEVLNNEKIGVVDWTDYKKNLAWMTF